MSRQEVSKIEISEIVENYNVRSLGGLGAQLGHDVLEIVNNLLNPETREEWVQFVQDNDPDVVVLANDLAKSQITPIVVTPVEDGYALIAGGHRLVATVYNHIMNDGPSTITAQIQNVSREEAEEISFRENFHRRQFTPLEEASFFNKMRKARKVNEKKLSELLNVPYHHVRNRLLLLLLPEDDQQKLAQGKIGVAAAQKKAEVIKASKKRGKDAAPAAAVELTPKSVRAVKTIGEIKERFLEVYLSEEEIPGKDIVLETLAWVLQSTVEDLVKKLTPTAGSEEPAKYDTTGNTESFDEDDE